MIKEGYYFHKDTMSFVKVDNSRSLFTFISMNNGICNWMFNSHTTWMRKTPALLKYNGVAYKKFIESRQDASTEYIKAFEQIYKKETLNQTKLGREIL